MKDVQTFLAELAQKRDGAQVETRARYVPPPLLDPALEVALNHRWRIWPINGHSRAFLFLESRRSPLSTRADVELLVDTYINLNWALETGEGSGVIALEIDDRARCTLAELTNADDEWDQGTLRFAVGSRWFLLFQYAAGLRTLKGCEGLRLHTDGDEILIPPSRTSRGIRIPWFEPEAPLLPSPSWTFESGRNCGRTRTSF